MRNFFRSNFFKSRTIQSALIVSFLGIVGVMFTHYLGRPTADVSMVIRQMIWIPTTLPEGWLLKAIVRVHNSGNQDTYIEYTDFVIKISNDKNKPYSLQIDKILAVSNNKIFYDTLMIRMPLKLFKRPSFKYGWIDATLPNGTTVRATFDSIDVKDNYGFSSTTWSSSDSQFIAIAEAKDYYMYDSLGNRQLKWQDYYVTYGAKAYQLKIFPPDIKVSHNIIDDRIELNFSYPPLSSSSEDGEGQIRIEEGYFRPFVLAPESIRDKLDGPQTMMTNIFSTTNQSQTLDVTNFEKAFGENSKEHRFYFKDDKN